MVSITTEVDVYLDDFDDEDLIDARRTGAPPPPLLHM